MRYPVRYLSFELSRCPLVRYPGTIFKITYMKQISTKQAQRNREIAKIKETLPSYCVICGKPAVDAAHLVPKSMYPEHYTNPLNIVQQIDIFVYE